MELNGKQVKEMLIDIAQMYQEKCDELSKLDAVIGDGDHGISMERGAKEAEIRLTAMSDDEAINQYFKTYGRALVEKIGGAMGPLFGSIFTEFGKCSKGSEKLTAEIFVTGIINSTNKVMDFGGAKVGNKTMVDGMVPTSEAVKEALEANKSVEEIAKEAVKASYQGLQNTIPLRAYKGRAKFLQDKSIGHQDAGATSYYYLMTKFEKHINGGV